MKDFLFIIFNFFQFWLRRIHDNRYQTDQHRQRAAILHGLDLKGVNEMHRLIKEITKRLEHYQLTDGIGPQRVNLTEREKNIILKVCISGKQTLFN